jgi:uncharacterized protein (DUF1810 family)
MLRTDLFVGAQQLVFDDAIEELKTQQKKGHWMWVVFPQHKRLGRSPTAYLFGLDTADVPEYLEHPILGPRYYRAVSHIYEMRKATSLGNTLPRVLGPVDTMKLRSSLTLFAPFANRVGCPIVQETLEKFFDQRCPLTLPYLENR